MNNLHPTMSKLNEDEYYEVIETIHSLMKDFNLRHKWVNDSLMVYPDNYADTLETSKYTNLLSTNRDSINFDDNHSDLFINFSFNFNNLNELKSIITLIKNATIENSIDWVESDLFHIRENTKKQDLVDTFTEKELSKMVKSLKKSLLIAIKVSNNELVDNLTKQIEELNSKLQEVIYSSKESLNNKI